LADRMLTSGLISSKPTGMRPRDFEPIKIDGPPLSQAIREIRDEGF